MRVVALMWQNVIMIDSNVFSACLLNKYFFNNNNKIEFQFFFLIQNNNS